MIPKELITYWIDLIQEDIGAFKNVDNIKDTVEIFRKNEQLSYFSIDNTGIFSYLITDDLLGGKCLSELIFYIRKENRGHVKLVLQYIKMAENLAKQANCTSIKIGGNIGYKDQSFLKLLKRLGYINDTVSKYL